MKQRLLMPFFKRNPEEFQKELCHRGYRKVPWHGNHAYLSPLNLPAMWFAFRKDDNRLYHIKLATSDRNKVQPKPFLYSLHYDYDTDTFKYIENFPIYDNIVKEWFEDNAIQRPISRADRILFYLRFK